MNEYPILLFNQTSESLRRIGARGGRAQARNRRARQEAARHDALPVAPCVPPPVESTAEAIATLDAGYPWLRGAERRCDARR
jgi:hypothetical protein